MGPESCWDVAGCKGARSITLDRERGRRTFWMPSGHSLDTTRTAFRTAFGDFVDTLRALFLTLLDTFWARLGHLFNVFRKLFGRFRGSICLFWESYVECFLRLPVHFSNELSGRRSISKIFLFICPPDSFC